MPIACVVEDKIFWCHGGLSPDLDNFQQIQQIVRPTDVPDQGLMCDLLWSDPDNDIEGWDEVPKGISYWFGKDVVSKFWK